MSFIVQQMDALSIDTKMVMNSLYGTMNDMFCLDTKSQMKYLGESDFDRNDETYNMTMQDMKGFNGHNLPVDNIRSKESMYFELFIQRESHDELELDEVFNEVTEDYNNDDIFEDEREYLVSPIYSYHSCDPRLYLCGDYESDFAPENVDYSYNKTILDDSCRKVKRKKDSELMMKFFNQRLQSQLRGLMPIYTINIV